ncbi:MAG: hypothetical protein ACREHD_33915, partial [Pirellulales bacterium]
AWLWHKGVSFMQGIVVLLLALIPLVYLVWKVGANHIKPANVGAWTDLSAALSRLHHLSIAIAFLLAVGRLFFINGCNGAALACFVFTPGLALLVAIANESLWNKRIAEWFLLAVGACVVNGWLNFLPGAFNQFPNLSRSDNRVLSGYLYVYHLYVFGIVPPYVLIRSIWRHRRGEPAMFSQVECWLYLAIWAALLVAFVINPDEAATEMIKAMKRHMLK